jgi:hypothetical protein
MAYFTGLPHCAHLVPRKSTIQKTFTHSDFFIILCFRWFAMTGSACSNHTVKFWSSLRLYYYSINELLNLYNCESGAQRTRIHQKPSLTLYLDSPHIFFHNTILNLQGGVKFPTGGKSGSTIPDSPRAPFALKTKGSADLVRFQSRRYSPDERGFKKEIMQCTAFWRCFAFICLFHLKMRIGA